MKRQNPIRLHLLQLEEHDLPSATPPCTPRAKTPTSLLKEDLEEIQVFQPEGHPKQAVIEGKIWPPVFVPENIRSAKAMKPRESDVFICTYPKCGTTWLQHIVHQLAKREQYQPVEGKELYVESPMIERMGILHIDEFIRKGGSRDWKNYLTKEQSYRMDTVYRTRCAGTIAQNWWQWEMGWDTMESVEAEMEKCSLQKDIDSNSSSSNDKETEEDDEKDMKLDSRRSSCSQIIWHHLTCCLVDY